ncbi:MAG: 2-dehydropantoate 2-reductase [Actinomycetota bacterium]
MRILLIGPGAIGLTVGGAALEHHDAALAIAARTRFDEMVLELDDTTVRHDVPVLTDPFAITGPFDLVLLGTKAHQTPEVAPWLRAACAPTTDVVVLQNGITHRERVGPLIGDASLVPAVVNIPADRVGPGHVRIGFRRQLIVPDDAAGQRTKAHFDGTFLTVTTTDDWHTASWGKLLMNAVVGTITVLTRTPNAVLADPDARALGVELAYEVQQVAIADGAAIDHGDFGPVIDLVADAGGDHVSSMTTDRLNNAPTEWRIRNLDVLERAARHGIETPLLRHLTTLIRLGEPDAERSL